MPAGSVISVVTFACWLPDVAVVVVVFPACVDFASMGILFTDDALLSADATLLDTFGEQLLSIAKAATGIKSVAYFIVISFLNIIQLVYQ